MPISFEPNPDITELDDWRLAGECFPFLDKSGEKLCISVRSPHLSPGPNSIERNNRFGAARRDGTEKLLRFYGKSLDEQYRNSLYGASEAADHFVSYKQCTEMLVLVKVDKDFFNSIPEDSSPYNINKPAEGYLSAFLSVRNFRKQIEFVTNRLHQYVPDMIRSDYFITNVNIVKEIDRLRLVADDIERYLVLNNVRVSPPDSISCPPEREGMIEIGFDYNYKPIFVLIEDCQHTIGYECFLNTPALNHLTTANYLINMSSMFNELTNSQSLNIINFYERHTQPRIMVSSKSVPSDGMPTYDDNGDSFGLADLAKLLSSQLSINLCKTKEEKLNEDKHLLDPPTRLQIALAAETGQQLVSDFSLSSKGAQDLKKRLKSTKMAFTDPAGTNAFAAQNAVDKVYNDVLAKLNLGCVLEETLQCYFERLVTLTGEAVFDDPDLTKVVNPNITFGDRLGLRCDDKGCDGTANVDFRVGLPVFQGMTIPENFPTTDFLASVIENALEQLYMALVNALVSLILGTIQNSCEFLFTDVLGEGDGNATIKDGFNDWLGATIGVDANSLNDPEAWAHAVQSKGGSGFMGVVGNAVSNVGEAFSAAYTGAGVSLNVPKDGNVEEVFLSTEAVVTFFKEFKDVTEDAEAILNERELHSVYKGTAEYETMELVYRCAQQRNPAFATLFRDPYELADLFSSLGKLVDSKFLENTTPSPPSVPSTLCGLGNGSEAAIVRAYLLQQKDSNITQSEINTILDKEKERTKQKVLQAMELLERYNNGGAISAFPSIFGTNDSLIPEMPSILSEAMSTATAASFGSVINNFSANTTYYPQAWAYMLERDEVEGRIEEWGTDSDGNIKEWNTNNPLSIWAGIDNPEFQYLSNQSDFYDFNFKSFEDMSNIGASAGGALDARYSVIPEWSFIHEFDHGGGNYDNRERKDRGDVRGLLEPIVAEVFTTYGIPEDIYVRTSSGLTDILLDWYGKADENNHLLGDPPIWDPDRYLFYLLTELENGPDDVAFYLSFSGATGLLSFETRRYESPEDRVQFAPDMSEHFDSGGLEIEQDSIEDARYSILQVIRQEPRFLSTATIRNSDVGLLSLAVAAPQTKRDITSVSYLQQRDYINTSVLTLGQTGFYDAPPTFATSSFSYNNKYPDTYTESSFMAARSGLATDAHSDSAGFLGQMVKNELSKHFISTGDLELIDGISEEVATKVYYDIIQQYLMQMKSQIINGKYWQRGSFVPGDAAEEGTAYGIAKAALAGDADQTGVSTVDILLYGVGKAVQESSVTRKVSKNVNKIDLAYPANDPLNYDELQSSSSSFVQKLVPLSFTDIYCDDLNPPDRARVTYAIKMFIRLAIVEHVMASLQVCTAFELGWMQGEMFATMLMREIKDKINDYQSAFGSTLEGRLWGDITRNARIYYEIKHILKESEKETYTNDENAFKDLIKEEARLIENNLVDAFNLGWKSNKWDGFLRRQMFLQFDTPPDVVNAAPGRSIADKIGSTQTEESGWLKIGDTEGVTVFLNDREEAVNSEAFKELKIAAANWVTNSEDGFGNYVPDTIVDRIIETFEELAAAQFSGTTNRAEFKRTTDNGDIEWDVAVLLTIEIHLRAATGADETHEFIRYRLDSSITPEYSESYKERFGVEGAAILSCFDGTTQVTAGTQIQADIPFDRGGADSNDLPRDFPSGGGFMYETYVKYQFKGSDEYNILGVSDFIEGQLGNLNNDELLTNIYDYINFGIRINLITNPLKQDEERDIRQEFPEASDGNYSPLKTNILQLGDIQNIAQREKAIFLLQQTRTINDKTAIYSYVSIPVASAECEYTSALFGPDIKALFDNGEYEDNIYPKLEQMLIESENYQILMENLFPIRDMIASLSLYQVCAMTNAATIRPIPNDFDMFKMLDKARLSTLQLLESSLYGGGKPFYEDPFVKKANTT